MNEKTRQRIEQYCLYQEDGSCLQATCHTSIDDGEKWYYSYRTPAQKPIDPKTFKPENFEPMMSEQFSSQRTLEGIFKNLKYYYYKKK